jgi:hypothetical protein
MRVPVIFVALALAACSRPAAHYPPQYEINFMRACQAQQGAMPERCACIWNRIEAEIDPRDFAALEQLPGPEREAHPLMQQIQGYKLACASAIPAPSAEPAPAP